MTVKTITQQNNGLKNFANKLFSAFTGRSRRLLSLTEVTAGTAIAEFTSAGLQTVSLAQIRGSATARYRDFDVNFRPLQKRTEDRLSGVRQARQRGLKLPPVSLIKIGDIFFVEDGHHRISVARSLGDVEIEASVTVGQVAE